MEEKWVGEWAGGAFQAEKPSQARARLMWDIQGSENRPLWLECSEKGGDERAVPCGPRRPQSRVWGLFQIPGQPSETCKQGNDIHYLCFRAVIFNLFHLVTHINELLKFCGAPENIFFANRTKNRYNFSSCILDGYYCVGCCHFFCLTISGKRGQCP